MVLFNDNLICILLYSYPLSNTSLLQYWDLNGTEITASDGYLMAILVDNVYSNSKPYGKIAKLKTSAVFESNFFKF